MSFEVYLSQQLKNYYAGNFDSKNIYVLSSLNDVKLLHSKLKNNEDLSFVFTWLQFHPINKFVNLLTDELFDFYFENYDNNEIPLSRALKRLVGFSNYEVKLMEFAKTNSSDKVFNFVFDEFLNLDRIYIHTFHNLGAKEIAWVKSIDGTYDLDYEIPNINTLSSDIESKLSLNMHLQLIDKRVTGLILIFESLDFLKENFTSFSELINRNYKYLDNKVIDKVKELFEKYNQKIEFNSNLKLSYLLEASHLLVKLNNQKSIDNKDLKNLELISENNEELNLVNNSFNTRESLFVDVEILLKNKIPIAAKINKVERLTNDRIRQFLTNGN